MYERVHSFLYVKGKIRPYLIVRFALASLSLANLMSCPCDKIISSETHVIVGLPKTGY